MHHTELPELPEDFKWNHSHMFPVIDGRKGDSWENCAWMETDEAYGFLEVVSAPVGVTRNFDRYFFARDDYDTAMQFMIKLALLRLYEGGIHHDFRTTPTT